MNETKNKTSAIIMIGMFTAIAAVISALPIGFQIFGVPATLQTFAMAFLGFILGKKNGTIAVAVYILLGLVGIPVYNGFTGGPSVLFGITGGFLWGFLFIAFFCGAAYEQKNCHLKNIILKILLPLVGLIICHVIGVIQFCLIMDMKLWPAAMAVSIPYIPKDILSMIIAYFTALSIRKALSASKIQILQSAK